MFRAKPTLLTWLLNPVIVTFNAIIRLEEGSLLPMSRPPLYHAVLLAALALLALAAPRLAHADGQPADLAPALRSMTQYLNELDDALTRGEVQAARHEYDELSEKWEAIEDGVRAQSPAAYTEIEDHLHALRDALAAQPVAVEKVRAAAQALDHELDEVVGKLGATAPATTGAATGASSLAELNEHVETALSRLAAGDRAGAQAELKRFTDGWGAVEDEVRAASRTSYRAIEDAMAEARVAFATEPFSADKARAALRGLETQTETYLTQRPTDGGSAESGAVPTSLAPLVSLLDRAASEAREGDAVKAASAVKELQQAWPGLEVLVATRSAQAYETMEEGMAKAYALLTSTPADTAAALAVLTEMQTELAPLTAQVRYGVADAAIIMLREGLEALLIIGALLAFLQKSNNRDKQRWVWLGGLAGVLASIVTAIALQRLFVSATAGANREIIEGVTGLLAAGLLVYVSYWLHSKSHLGAWQQYIRQQSNAALVRNSLLSLASIAFLAVFREGAETVVFYMGIAPAIALADLMLGIGLAVVVLVVLGVLMLRYGVRIPLRPFFLVTSLLLYYMAFKFVGTGIHALQMAGAVPATPNRFLPSWQPLGLFPTLETTAVQLLLLVLALAVVLLFRRQTPILARS